MHNLQKNAILTETYFPQAYVSKQRLQTACQT